VPYRFFHKGRKEMECVKLLHLSDLHIGKRVNECSMLEDQRYILEQIAQLAIERKVDGVLLAGDLYDKPVPPAEAVTLLDTFFTALSRAGIPVFAISGNHDSPERLSFGARLLTGTGIYLSAVYQGPQEPVLLRDAYGEVAIYLLPYLKPALVRHSAPEAEIATYQDAVSYALQQWTVPPSRRNVGDRYGPEKSDGGASVCHRGDHQRIRGTFGRRVGPGEWRTV